MFGLYAPDNLILFNVIDTSKYAFVWWKIEALLSFDISHNLAFMLKANSQENGRS